MCKRRRGQNFCRVSFSHSPTGGGQRSECAKVFGRRGSSPSGEGGWLLSLSLGKVVGERGAETEGQDQEGGFSPSLQQVSGPASQKQVAGTTGSRWGRG